MMDVVQRRRVYCPSCGMWAWQFVAPIWVQQHGKPREHYAESFECDCKALLVRSANSGHWKRIA